jgi:UDP-glucose 4-epimerase
LTGNKSDIRMVPYTEAYAPGFEDMQRRQPDTSRIEAAIGWRPELDLDATLRRVQSWMLESRRS